MPKQTPAGREATGATTTQIEFRGESITIPATAEHAHPKALRAFERGRAMEGVESLVGSDVFDRILDDPAVTMADVNDLVRLIVEETWGISGD